MSQAKCKVCRRNLYLASWAIEDPESYWCVDCALDKENTKCECGAAKVGSPRHSDWCKRYGMDTPQHPRRLPDVATELLTKPANENKGI